MQHLIGMWRSISFAVWSLRRRGGQALPVALSLLLLVCAVQVISVLHDVSSVLTQQQVARTWRSPYDLLVRPSVAVSTPELNAGWIAPQSLLETYGGIRTQQVASIKALAHVVQITPVAVAGWQTIDALVPLEFASKGIYRISAAWNKQDTPVVRYVEVTDLAQLTNEVQLADPIVQHVLIGDGVSSATYTLSLQTLQAIIGVPTQQQTLLRQAILENVASASAMHLLLHVERLQGTLSMLPACMKDITCWIRGQALAGPIHYQVDGVQLLRYSRTNYAATPQQLAAGEVSLQLLGRDTQGPLYRIPLSGHLVVPADSLELASDQLSSSSALPYSDVERLPLLTGAVRFVPLDQACAVNGVDCYSGLYVRLTGTERYDQQSLALLQATAAAIVARTGLHVDILDGSSLRTIALTGPGIAQATTTVPSTWRVVGVAIQIVNGVDGLQEILLVLCSLVCLLAIGVAGVLVGIGRRKDGLILRQVGWQQSLLLAIFTLDGLMLCLPGCVLSVGWSLLAIRLWPGNVSLVVMWVLLGVGVLVYCLCLMGATGLDFDGPGQRKSVRTRAVRAKFTGQMVCGVAIVASVFLIAEGYILTTTFNQLLIVTLLGRQVREVLTGPQLLLVLIIMGAALLTVGLCTKLLLQGRRDELVLLARIGWERRNVLLRILEEGWSLALISGVVGVLLALVTTVFLGVPASLLPIVVIVVCGPVVGVLLSSIVTFGIAWQETGRMYSWR